MKYCFTDRKRESSIWFLINAIAKALIKRGDEVIFCYFDDGYQSSSPPPGVEIIDIRVPKKRHIWDIYTQYRLFTREFRQLLHHIKPDIVHTNFAIPAIAARIAAHQENVPIIVSTQHELFNSMHPHYRWGLRMTEKYANAITYVSNTVAKSFGREIANSTKHSVIYNGIDVELIKSIADKSGERKQHKLVCAGRFVSVKGQAVLLQAMPKILVQFPETKLVLIGAGPDEVALKKQVDNLGIVDSVQFCGWLSYEETITEMATAEVLVVPSTGEQEGFGLVVAEGMAVNTPIVASHIQVFEEVLGADESCGWFFDKNNPDSLNDVICQAFAQSYEAEARASRASFRVQERFSIERMVSDYLKLYDSLK